MYFYDPMEGDHNRHGVGNQNVIFDCKFYKHLLMIGKPMIDISTYFVVLRDMEGSHNRHSVGFRNLSFNHLICLQSRLIILELSKIATP